MRFLKFFLYFNDDFLLGLDIIPLVGTFVCCLALGIEIGLICGVGVDVLLLLYYHSRPPLDVKYVDVSIFTHGHTHTHIHITPYSLWGR